MRIARSVLLAAITMMTPLVASSVIPRDIELSQHEANTIASSSALVERVRRATEGFKDPTLARGYEQFLGCVSGPQGGAMGVHFVNGVNVDDGEIDVTRPEALIYESRNGAVHLVGVEFIVKAKQWHDRHKEPPVLEGQVFHYNTSPNRYGLEPFYELHVWAWRENPNGAFSDWNSRVSCEGQ